ncbi:MAG: hypothetical protein H0V81_04175 [Solirubrobacterales bacterium]|nr:hypothetical protein [Solirubrobacterales bacterium]
MSLRVLPVAIVTALALVLVPGAGAATPPVVPSLSDPLEQWLPSPDDGSWTYEWYDSTYAQRRTIERYTVESREGSGFRLAWTTEGLPNAADAVAAQGEVDYRRTALGLVNLNWASTPPPPEFPILCSSAEQCANSLAGTHYMLIWGNRSPVLLEPLVRGARWNSAGGAGNDVSSSSRYVGREVIAVPAFPRGVRAAVVETEVNQAGAIGDPYGSGVRTVWWVRGVGPVKVRFRHTGGEVTESELAATTLEPRPLPSDAALLPLNRGDKMRFRWRNSKHMRKGSVQDFEVAEVINNTARVDVKNVSGPLRVAGSYVFSSRLGGVVNVSGFTRAASLATFPPLGPASLPADKRRRLFTPFDLMAFGFNPVLPAYPVAGQTWKNKRGSRDDKVFGVRGTSTVLPSRRIRTPIGTFRAVGVRSVLVQKGFRFGSGTRTSWFAAGKGLVKLEFRHRDGSVSTVERLR